MIDVQGITDKNQLLKESKWLEGKTLEEVFDDIELSTSFKVSDKSSRVSTKASVGYVIESGFFGVNRNSSSLPDLPHLEVEIKISPLKYNRSKTKLSVKEPLSLSIINYFKEASCNDIKESAIYKKNKNILFVFYIHDPAIPRSSYIIKYVFLWKIDEKVVAE